MVPSAVANIALGLLGKIPVNLNFTTNQAMIDSAVEQCGIRRVITASKVLEKCQMRPKAELILLEDVPARVKLSDKLWGAAVARLAPDSALGAFLPGLSRRGLDDLATVIFTSGSTGEPKGVMLSHRNILSNVHQIEEQIHLHDNEVILGILPFFHSFGFTVGLWTPLALGKSVVYHFNPLDARTIGKMCDEHDVTLIAGTPSFTRFYLKNCRPEQFHALTHLLLGAEKLKPETYRDINETLKIEPMEGYGTTELSPVVAVNVPAEVELAPDDFPGGIVEEVAPEHHLQAAVRVAEVGEDELPLAAVSDEPARHGDGLLQELDLPAAHVRQAVRARERVRVGVDPAAQELLALLE